jgi:RimJ/RimL family protein N-acetyltransferase
MKKTTRPALPICASPLRTERLLLRPYQPTDLDDFHALRSQMDVMKWTSQGTVDASRDATQTWMKRFLPPNDATTHNFAIEELTNPGVVIGAIGCHTAEPAECGYMLRTEYWGKGYATEAFKRWLQAWWELPREVIVVDDSESGLDTMIPEVLRADFEEDNVASGRILAGSGFQSLSETMVDAHGTQVKLITLQLERPAC